MFKIVPSEEGGSQEEALLAFNNEYIPINSIADRFGDLPETERKKIYGKSATVVNSRINKEAKELEVELVDKLADNVDIILSTYKAKINELTEANASLKENTDKAAKAEIEKLTQEVSDYKKLSEKLKGDFENVSNEKKTIETEFTQKQIELMINSKLALAKSEFVLVEDINIRDACLFEESKYKFTVDENQNEVVYDLNGQVVLSSEKAGEFACYKEVFKSIYTKRKALKVNDPTNLPLLDKGKNTSAPLSGRFDMSSKITLGKK